MADSEREFQDFDCASLVEKQESKGVSTASCVTAVWADGPGLPVSLEHRDSVAAFLYIYMYNIVLLACVKFPPSQRDGFSMQGSPEMPPVTIGRFAVRLVEMRR